MLYNIIVNENDDSRKGDLKMKKEINAILNKELSKSKKMVELYLLGLEIKEVSEVMGVRYNFSYNVISNYCRMNDVDLRVRAKGDSKKDKIVELIQAGKTNNEISKELKCNYNYVWKIRKEFETKEFKKVK